MKTYTFQRPILTDSQKEIFIYDECGNPVGKMNRWFKDKFSYGVNWITAIINVKAEDLDGNVSILIQDQGFLKTLIQSKWDVTYRRDQADEELVLFDKTKIKTNRRLEYKLADREVVVSKDIGDRIVRFREKNGKMFAEGTFDKMVPPSTDTIRIYDENIHICEIAAIYFLLHIQV